MTPGWSNTVARRWRVSYKCGMTRTTRYASLNDCYFDEVSQEPNAYWLGFLLADGNVCKSAVTLALSSRDAAHVVAFASAVGLSAGVVKSYVAKSGYQSTRLSFRSDYMANRLRQLECFDRKSTIHGFPDVPADAQRHLIRGYFDGNGSVHSYKCVARSGHVVSPRWSTSIVGPRRFIDAAAGFVKSTVGIEAAFRQTKSVWEMRFSAIDDMLRFSDYMYDGASVYLERKRTIFEDIRTRTSLRSTACSTEGCGKSVYSDGLCQRHYKGSVGIRSTKCLFTLEQERDIFNRRSIGVKLRALANEYGCSTSSIFDACERESKRQQSLHNLVGDVSR